MAHTTSHLYDFLNEAAHWRTAWLRGGKIRDVAWIGDSVVAWESGLHIVFYDVERQLLRIPRVSALANGAGVCCVAGHPSLNVFAYAEKGPNPRICVQAYPSLLTIAECHDGTEFGYLATAFSGDFLVSLASLPNFEISVWLWRTGEKLSSTASFVKDAEDFGQVIKISHSQSKYIAQVGRVSGKLYIWDMVIAGRQIHLLETRVRLPDNALVNDVAWDPGARSLLAIADRQGHIYLCNQNGSNLRRIVTSRRCELCEEIETAILCWFRGGIALKTTFCQIRYYRPTAKDQLTWKKVWYMKTAMKPCVLTAHVTNKDRLLYFTREGYIINFDFTNGIDKPVSKVQFNCGGEFRFVEFVHPWDRHVVAVDQAMGLILIDGNSGIEIANLDLQLKGKILQIASNLHMPLVAVASDEGEVAFLSLLDSINPNFLGKYNLQKEEIDLIRFSYSGSHLLACRKESGVCYIITTSAQHGISIRCRLQLQLRIVDVLLFSDTTEDDLKLYVLRQSTSKANIGHELLFYNLEKIKTDFLRPLVTIDLKVNFGSLEYSPVNAFEFIGTPWLSKHVRTFIIQNLKKVILTEAVQSSHNVRQVKIYTTNNWIAMGGLDGLVSLRKNTVQNFQIMTFMTHHSRDFGVRKAMVSCNGDCIVGLGVDGSIVTIKHFLKHKEDDEDQIQFPNLHKFAMIDLKASQEEIVKNAKSLKAGAAEFLMNSVIPFVDSSENSEINYSEWRKKRSLIQEKKQSAKEKASIKSEFMILKNKLINILNRNEQNPEIKRLPIATFDLNVTGRKNKILACEEERNRIWKSIQDEIFSRNQMADWMEERFWSSQIVKAQSIFGMLKDIEVTNYATTNESMGSPDLQRYADFCRTVMTEIIEAGEMETWKPHDPQELRSLVDKQVRCKKIEEIEADRLLQEEDKEIDPEELENERISEGITIHRFVEPCGTYYSQYEIYAYAQVLSAIQKISRDTKRLRAYFNELFDKMALKKQTEMAFAQERAEQLIQMEKELNEMFNRPMTKNLSIPQWRLQEKPELIIEVQDSEIKSKPYISPEEQEALDREAAERARLQRELAADDFKDKALDAMMDGVLELKWEDQIKKDVPKPDCMESKSPEDYTDIDKAEIANYENAVNALAVERKKYRKIVETKAGQLKTLFQNGLDDFNAKLEDFHVYKIKLQSAVEQLHLRLARYIVRHVTRTKSVKNDEVIKSHQQELQSRIETLEKEIVALEGTGKELYNTFNQMEQKDKNLEKKFYTEFYPMGKAVFTYLQNWYKKRPRVKIHQATPHELRDLSENILKHNRPSYLSTVCMEYLKGIEKFGSIPTTAPPEVESSQWEILIPMRYAKIEHELKMRAVNIEIETLGQNVVEFQGQISVIRESMNELKKELNKQRQLRINYDHNLEVQIVLKMGQVEILLDGDLYQDTAKAFLITAAEIHRVNEAVLSAGDSKLRMINRDIEFRGEVKFAEWQHACEKMKVDQLRDQLYFINKSQLTREMRFYLQKSTRVQHQQSDLDIEAIGRSKERLIEQWQARLKQILFETEKLKGRNRKLDKQIVRMNVDRCEMENKKENECERIRDKFYQRKMKIVSLRNEMVDRLLTNHEDIMCLCDTYQGLRKLANECKRDDVFQVSIGSESLQRI